MAHFAKRERGTEGLDVRDGCTVIGFIFRKTNLLPIKCELQIPMRNNDVKDAMSQKSLDKINVVCRKRKCGLLQRRVNSNSINADIFGMIFKKYYF